MVNQSKSDRHLRLRAVLVATFFLATLVVVQHSLAAEDGILAVRAEQLELLWTPVRQDRPKLPYTFLFNSNLPCTQLETDTEVPWQRGSRPGYCGLCAVVGYVIEADGSTSGHRVLRVVPEVPEFRARALFSHVVRAMRRWRFEPTLQNAQREAVYTYYINSIVLHDNVPELEREAAHEALSKLCEVASFP